MLTIQEWAKLNPQPLASGIVEVIANNNPILGRLPFMNIQGNAYKYNQEETLPGIAFRDFNQGYTESTGVVNPQYEALTILGGESDFDVAEIAMQSSDNDVRAIHDAMKAKALALKWLETFFSGDTSVDPLSFDGLNKRLVGPQLLTCGDAANGAQLSLNDLDALVDAVIGTPDMLVMSKAMRAQVRRLARLSPSLLISSNQFGQEVTSYQGVPIAVVEVGLTGNDLLGPTETLGTSTNCSSIYAVSFGPDRLLGLQNSPISVEDLGRVTDKPAYRTRIEWYSTIALKHPRACARLQGVLPAAA